MKTFASKLMSVFLLLAGSLVASAQVPPEVFLSASNFGGSNASTNTSIWVCQGQSKSAFIWVDDTYTVNYGMCLDVSVTGGTGVAKITAVEVFNPDIVVAGTVAIDQRWSHVSHGINATTNSVENICGLMLAGGYGISPQTTTGNVFEDALHDPNSNAFLFARIDLQGCSTGSVDLTLTEGIGGIFGPPLGINFGKLDVNAAGGLGKAVLTSDDSAGTLVVDNLGSSGQDGVRAQAKRPGRRTVRAGFQWNDLGVVGPYGAGAELSFTVLGDRVGQPDTELGTLSFTETSSGEIEINADYPHSSTYTLVVINGDATVAVVEGHTGTIATVIDWPKGCGKQPWWTGYQTDCIDSCWAVPIAFDLPGSALGPMVGDRLLVLAEEGEPVEAIEEIELRTRDIPSITLTDLVADNVVVGDVNDDGLVNLSDIAPFVNLLSAGFFQAEADINGDGLVNLSDIGPFVDLLSG